MVDEAYFCEVWALVDQAFDAGYQSALRGERNSDVPR